MHLDDIKDDLRTASMDTGNTQHNNIVIPKAHVQSTMMMSHMI